MALGYGLCRHFRDFRWRVVTSAMDQIEEVFQKTFRERVHSAAIAGIISRELAPASA